MSHDDHNNAPTKSGQQLTNTIIGMLAIAFLAWAGVVWDGTQSIANKMDSLANKIHDYQVQTENRLTELEGRTMWLSREYQGGCPE
jgi:flagellar capping protein FliD